MNAFIDTSALYALLDSADRNHARAARIFPALESSERLVTTNYVVVETAAIVQRRIGKTAMRDLTQQLLAPVEILWMDQQLHERAHAAWLAGASRRVSFVDRTSFESMRAAGIVRACI